MNPDSPIPDGNLGGDRDSNSPGRSPAPDAQVVIPDAQSPVQTVVAQSAVADAEAATAGPSASAPEKSGSEPRVKRSYTASERSRQASRENLAWARLVGWQKMQSPGYQPSPRRLAANRANLILGVKAKRRDDSAGYASCFRDGLSAVSLERSLKLAGESREDYRRHLDWFRRAFTRGAEGLTSAAGVLTLATAIGLASWRRLRGFRTLGEWEGLAVCHFLRELAEERREGAELTWQRSLELAEDLRTVLREGRQAVEKRLRKIDHRLEALASRLLLERGEESMEGRAGTSEVVDHFEFWPAEALGNPLVNPLQVTAALGDRPVEVAEAAGWEQGVNRARFWAGLSPALHQGWNGRLLREARGRDAGSAGTPDSFEDFLQLVQAALGEQRLDPAAAQATQSAGTEAKAGAELKEFAQALWDRLELFGEQAGTEAEALRELREAYAGSLDSGEESEAGAEEAGPLARELLQLFRDGERAFGQAEAADYRVAGAAYGWLVKRYGERPEFRELKPREPDHTGLLIMALLLDGQGKHEEAGELLRQFHDLEARAGREPPKDG